MNGEPLRSAACRPNRNTRPRWLPSAPIVKRLVVGGVLAGWALSLSSGCAVHVPLVTDALKQPFEKTVEQQTSGSLEATRVEVFTNNDVALQKKIELVDKATSRLRLAYFIFSNDESSSTLAAALIRAARRGVHVQLLVDLNNDYRFLDYYSMLEREGAGAGGQIEVRFYGRPEREFLKDVAYVTSGCQDVDPEFTNLEQLQAANAGTGNDARCASEKLQKVREFFDAADGEYEKRMSFSSANTGLSGLFLSGLYSKNADLLSAAVIAGQQLDVKRLKQGSATKLTEEQKTGLIEFLKLYFQAKTASNPFVRLRHSVALALAGVLYGEAVNPLRLALEHYLPTESKSSKGWIHEQDFVHHKYLLSDALDFQAGGRNVENSYHMSPDALIEKYIFMDTDIHVELKSGADALAKSFDELWNYSPVVASMQEVRTFAPNDTLVELNAKRAACEPNEPVSTSAELPPASIEVPLTNAVPPAAPADSAAAPSSTPAVDACKRAFVPPSFEQRLDRERQALDERVRMYQATYGALTLEQRVQRYHPAIQRHIVGAQERGELGRYTLVDPHPRVDYVENLPYLHAGRVGGKGVPSDVRERTRVWGTELNGDTLDAKSIHRVWHHGFLNNCRGAHPNSTIGPKRVILHQAYLAFSPDMLDVLGRMVDGALDCSNVTLDIITNSVQTTDLGIIDVVGKMFMAQLFNSFTNPRVVQLGFPNRAARLRLYEYKSLLSELTPNAPSLHSKVVVLDETTMWIGSANMDTRSITMDTNNGLLLRDVPSLVADFTRRFEHMQSDPELVTFVADNGTPQLVAGSYQRAGKRGVFYERTVEQFRQTGWQAMYEKFVKPRKLEKAQEAKLETRFHDILNRLYALSERVIFGNVVGGALQAETEAMQALILETTNF